MAFDTPVMEHWLEREIAQWVHDLKQIKGFPILNFDYNNHIYGTVHNFRIKM